MLRFDLYSVPNQQLLPKVRKVKQTLQATKGLTQDANASAANAANIWKQKWRKPKRMEPRMARNKHERANAKARANQGVRRLYCEVQKKKRHRHPNGAIKNLKHVKKFFCWACLLRRSRCTVKLRFKRQ